MVKIQRILLYVLLVFALLSPLLTLTDNLNCLFFRDYLYISNSICILILGLFIAARFKLEKFVFTKLDLLIVLYVLYNAINLLVLNPLAASEEMVYLCLQLIFYFAIKQFFSRENAENENAKYFFILSLIFISLIPILIGILEYSGIISQFGIGFIMTGGFFNQGVFANFIAALFPFTLSVILFIDTTKRSIRIFSIIVFLASFVILIVTTARSAWIASFISAIFVLLHHQNITRAIRKLFDSKIKKLIVIGIVAIAIFGSSIFLYNFKKDSADGRTFIWKICMNMIKEKPLFGNGYSTFHASYNDHQKAYFKQNPQDTQNGMLAGEAKFAFNDYLETMTETGILGILLFVGIVFYALMIKTPIDETSIKSRYMLVAVKSSILSIMICSLFSYPLRNAINYTLLIVFISFISAIYDPKKIYEISRKKVLFSITLGSFFVVLFILYTQLTSFQNCYKWSKAYKKTESINVTEALETYKTLMPEFNDNFLFLFNYGSTLYKVGDFDGGVKVLETAMKYNSTLDIYLNLGDCYDKTNQFDKAEVCYLNASNLVPHKLTPRYKLFKLYVKTNQSDNARKCALFINEMEIKVYSPLAGQFKKEAMEYLNKSSNAPI